MVLACFTSLRSLKLAKVVVKNPQSARLPLLRRLELVDCGLSDLLRVSRRLERYTCSDESLAAEMDTWCERPGRPMHPLRLLPTLDTRHPRTVDRLAETISLLEQLAVSTANEPDLWPMQLPPRSDGCACSRSSSRTRRLEIQELLRNRARGRPLEAP